MATDKQQSPLFHASQIAGLAVGGTACVVILLSTTPEGLTPAAWRTAAVACLMAVWWITEAIPIPATALLPIVVFPVLGITTIRETTGPYANPLVFLFMGGCIIALSMQRWGLHRRIALSIIWCIGTQPRAIVAGFMVASAFLSMWVSNTATSVMMLPIAMSVIELVRSTDEAADEAATGQAFSLAILLGIAYACSIGGVATTIGTPTNALLVSFVDETYGYEIGFAQWMRVGLPLVVIGLPIAYFILTHVAFRLEIESLPGGRDFIRDELEKLGRMDYPQRMVAVVFASVATMWMLRPQLEHYVSGLSDTGIAMLGAVVLFLIPVDWKRGLFLMDWNTAEKLPWGVLILFGGGLTLASAINDTGLATWIGGSLSGLRDWPLWLVVTAATAVIILVTELTSNVATVAAFLPIVASVALGFQQHPLMLAVPVTMAASCAFMLPVATPPNAVIYGSGMLRVHQMARAGALLNVAFVILVSALGLLLVPLVFDLDMATITVGPG